VTEDCENAQSIDVGISNTVLRVIGIGKRKYRVEKVAPEFFSLHDKFQCTTQKLKLGLREKKLVSTAYDQITTTK
jgi:hypothetical protein